ncbi:methionyl-tRNA formyltransferase [Polaribacter litorisediminis]|uniref:methionyl-tRNA formyltransferase n=1 Tax=Polaribacter litorisediminis TaxID=1908341 RepID=UPI001CBE4E17|nr:methionyl-tRNA formyltransferase [Polaribacter litorisediminis]UAM97202.1 methionyl-tRNA formyltransferase [Polaribacter litorisediminis]
MKLTNIIVSEKKWNKDLISKLENQYKNTDWILIDHRDDFTCNFLGKRKIDKIFIPHWSYIIPESIYSNYECIVFHMTDLPFGRGGSPLQNLIVRGHKETQISALRVVKELDAGPIYLKRPLSLTGSATEIFTSANDMIERMILEIIAKDLKPKKQAGEIVTFKRRTPKESNLKEIEDLEKVFDYIRMLDAEGYPHAFLETSALKFEFTNANQNTDEEIITAHVRIFKK